MKEQIWARIDRLTKTMDTVNWDDPQIYAAYMAQTYYYVSHSTRLLALAAGLLPLSAGPAHQRFIKHISEENRHEVLASRDVTALGYRLEDFKELDAVKAFYRLQYYMIQNVSPWSLLGYIAALEALAVRGGPAIHERVCRRHGEKTGSFLKVHSAEDVEHVEQAFAMIESLPTDVQAAVWENLEMSCTLFEAFLRDLPLAYQATTLVAGQATPPAAEGKRKAG